MIDLVVFDAVGTLLHPTEPIAHTYRRIFSDFAIDSDEQSLKAQFRSSFVKHFEPIKLLDADHAIELAQYLIDHPSVQLSSSDLSNAHLAILESIRSIHSDTNEQHQKECWQNVVIDCVDLFAPNAPVTTKREIFDSLWRYFAKPQAWSVDPNLCPWIALCQARNLPWIVASNFDSRLFAVVAGHPEFASCAKIYDSASMGIQKPDLRFYQAITDDFHLPPKNILMIGDNAIGDFLAPKLFGWQAHWLREPTAHLLQQLLDA